jgi:aromatic ring-opening dioxygenase catalytic subunit (LigB family)
MPVVFVPHGGGPLPLLNDPAHRELIAFMRGLSAHLPQPKAILLISAHWEEPVATLSSSLSPSMLYDYQGFPPATYEYQYPAAGKPELAQHIAHLLQAQGLEVRLDSKRGFDHGTFVPLMLIYPEADIPVVQLSLLHSLDPAAHIAMGKAIAPLRDAGVLIMGSGMSFHNMRAFFANSPATTARSEIFDQWLTQTLTDVDLGVAERQSRLEAWQSAPEARFSHPREEHLLPLHVCFGAASLISDRVERLFSGFLFNSRISAFLWP